MAQGWLSMRAKFLFTQETSKKNTAIITTDFYTPPSQLWLVQKQTCPFLPHTHTDRDTDTRSSSKTNEQYRKHFHLVFCTLSYERKWEKTGCVFAKKDNSTTWMKTGTVLTWLSSRQYTEILISPWFSIFGGHDFMEKERKEKERNLMKVIINSPKKARKSKVLRINPQV